jgi:NTP pyrophosphatase (non-canonical NTP hydrolase)
MKYVVYKDVQVDEACEEMASSFHHAGYMTRRALGTPVATPTHIIDLVSQMNRARAKEWHRGIKWSLADWSNALCGEVGELANVVKKLRRLETGTGVRMEEMHREDLITKAKKEVADVFLYLDLLLEQLDSDAEMLEVVADKFNETSETFGFAHRL